ncbi:MAG: hypothetical protein KAI83_20240 [Thiomargarita sp.]|nr:hypothetical protein [Thiomargarita sp.]
MEIEIITNIVSYPKTITTAKTFCDSLEEIASKNHDFLSEGELDIFIPILRTLWEQCAKHIVYEEEKVNSANNDEPF